MSNIHTTDLKVEYATLAPDSGFINPTQSLLSLPFVTKNDPQITSEISDDVIQKAVHDFDQYLEKEKRKLLRIPKISTFKKAIEAIKKDTTLVGSLFRIDGPIEKEDLMLITDPNSEYYLPFEIELIKIKDTNSWIISKGVKNRTVFYSISKFHFIDIHIHNHPNPYFVPTPSDFGHSLRYSNQTKFYVISRDFVSSYNGKLDNLKLEQYSQEQLFLIHQFLGKSIAEITKKLSLKGNLFDHLEQSPEFRNEIMNFFNEFGYQLNLLTWDEFDLNILESADDSSIEKWFKSKDQRSRFKVLSSSNTVN